MLFWEITDALVHGRETEEKYQSNFYQTRLQTMLRIIFRNETQDVTTEDIIGNVDFTNEALEFTK